MRWLLLLALTGCSVMFPHAVDTETPRSVHVVNEVAGPPGVIALDVTSSYGTLHIDAMHVLHCYREVRQFVEHKPQTAPGLLAGPAVIAAVGVANALESESTLEDRTLSTTSTDCSVPARSIRFEVSLPSGAIVRGVTDVNGLAHVKIPATEPVRGVASVRAGESAVLVEY